MRHYNWFLAIASMLAIGSGTAGGQTFTPVHVYGQFGQVYLEDRWGQPDLAAGTCQSGQACLSDPQLLPGFFNTPLGVATDRNGQIVVADTFNHRLQILGPDGTHRLTIGGLGSRGIPDGEVPLIAGLAADVMDAVTNTPQARLFYPTGVALDAAGKIVVADYWNHRIVVYRPDGTLFSVLGDYTAVPSEAVNDALGGFAYPFRVAVRGGTRLGDPMDAAGRLYVLDQGNHRVQVFNAMLMPLGAFGGGSGNEAGRFYYPNDLTYDDRRHELLVTDGNNNRVQVFSADGTFQLEFGSGALETPLATAIDAQGRIFVVDKLDRVRVFTRDAAGVQHATDFGSRGSALGEINYGGGIASAAYGRIVIADSDNHRIQVFEGERPADGTPPVSTATLRRAPNGAGWVNAQQAVTFTATDEGEGVDVIVIDPVLPEGPETRVASGSQLTFADGVHVLDYYAIDRAGNREMPKRLEIRVDSIAPAITCASTGAILWPPNHKMVPVSFAVNTTDRLSGATGFILAAATSNEPDNGVGDGDQPNDLQGWVIGTPDTAGFVRAERAARGPGRTYSFRYESRDAAGNVAACAVATATVAPAARK
jgi:sugar lactone lactonase YvrE